MEKIRINNDEFMIPSDFEQDDLDTDRKMVSGKKVKKKCYYPENKSLEIVDEIANYTLKWTGSF